MLIPFITKKVQHMMVYVSVSSLPVKSTMFPREKIKKLLSNLPEIYIKRNLYRYK